MSNFENQLLPMRSNLYTLKKIFSAYSQGPEARVLRNNKSVIIIIIIMGKFNARLKLLIISVFVYPTIKELCIWQGWAIMEIVIQIICFDFSLISMLNSSTKTQLQI